MRARCGSALAFSDASSAVVMISFGTAGSQSPFPKFQGNQNQNTTARFILFGNSAITAAHQHLRVGLGQNGQILFISVEQLSLNVAGDSAKTLSVLGNMGGVLDDCGIRFMQMCRRPSQNNPDFGGPIWKKKITGMQPY